MARFKDADWDIAAHGNGPSTFDGAILATLMDLRDELKRFNALLHCPNFMGIPSQLRHMEIAAKRANANAAKRRKKG